MVLRVSSIPGDTLSPASLIDALASLIDALASLIDPLISLSESFMAATFCLVTDCNWSVASERGWEICWSLLSSVKNLARLGLGVSPWTPYCSLASDSWPFKSLACSSVVNDLDERTTKADVFTKLLINNVRVILKNLMVCLCNNIRDTILCTSSIGDDCQVVKSWRNLWCLKAENWEQSVLQRGLLSVANWSIIYEGWNVGYWTSYWRTSTGISCDGSSNYKVQLIGWRRDLKVPSLWWTFKIVLW